MKWGLRTKLLFSVGCFIFLTLAASTGIHIHTLKRDYREAITWRSEALAQNIIVSITTTLESMPNIQGVLEAKSVQCITLYELNKDKNVTHFAIINAQGLIAAHNDKTLWNTPVKNPDILAALQHHKTTTILDGTSYHTLIPLFKDQETFIGMVDIGFPKQVVDQKIRQMLLNAVGLLSFFWIVTFLTISGLLHIFINKPLGKLMNGMQKVEAGHLNVEVAWKSHDEIGKLAERLNHMIAQLRMLVGQVQRSGFQVSTSTTQLSATAKEQELIIKHQMESMQTTVQSIKEITDVSLELLETMRQVASMSSETAQFARSGQTDLSRMEDAMHHMKEASQSISGRLKTIYEKAENITTVVTTITKIAEQTNLLSLNAAIEAEKAGEYGLGFTVVAREIRRLADQTAVATLDIEQMVKEMQTAVSTGVMEMDKFIAEVEQSVNDVGNISMQLSLITEQVQTLSPNFEQVNVAMGRQAETAQNIHHTMMELDEEMQETRNSLQETYTAIEQLNETASNLRDEISQFQVNN
ncbi:MAG: methyl-accepting chemotaxis protein [Candidatus Vecturithrix sp.]|jgi:methyl-accepting chemotaxis protein|nr:methyl-accepting chemotaxis protein [Candidatus Vecturithrix sp.]